MSRSGTAALAVLLLAAGASGAAPPARAPVFTLRIKSMDALRSDFVYLLTQIRPEETQAKRMWDAFLRGATFNQGLPAWWDTTRPFGLSASGIPTGPQEVSTRMAAFVPVHKDNDFLLWIKGLELMPEKDAAGIYQIKIPDNPSIAFRFTDGFVWLTSNPALLRGKLGEPAVPGGDKESVIALGLRPDQLTKEKRQALFRRFNTFVDDNVYGPLAQGIRESDAEYQTRLGNKMMAREGMIQAVEGVKELTLAFGADRKQRSITCELTYAPAAGTKVAGRLKELRTLRSRFSHLSEDALLRVYLHAPLLERWQEILGVTFPQLQARALRHVPDARDQALLKKLFAALKPNVVGTDLVDFGVAFRRLRSGGPGVLVGGFRFEGAPGWND